MTWLWENTIGFWRDFREFKSAVRELREATDVLRQTLEAGR